MRAAKMGMAAALWLAMACASGAQVLEIEAKASCSGPRVLLQDLVRPGYALPEGWGTRSIADAPPLAQTRELTLPEIAQALNAFDDMRNVVLRGRTVVQVTAKQRTLDAEQMQRAVDRFAQASEEWKGRRFEVITEKGVLPNVPHGSLEIEVMGIKEGPEYGKVAAEVRLTVDGVAVGKETARVELAELRPFWAANRPLNRGETLTEEMLDKQWLADRDGARHYPADKPVAGMALRRSVQAGQLFAVGMLAEPMHAKRVEIVRVISQRGGLTVTLRARALADGRRAEKILCVNEQSGKRMNVRLVHPRRALLEDETEEEQT